MNFQIDRIGEVPRIEIVRNKRVIKSSGSSQSYRGNMNFLTDTIGGVPCLGQIMCGNKRVIQSSSSS